MSDNCTIIQGGMGVGVSGWKLAQAVSRAGQLGVVSGTALDQVLARRLQDGDIDGAMRRGLEGFPFPAMAARVRKRYFIAGGKPERTPYLAAAPLIKDMSRDLAELSIVSNFVEIFLAREGHENPVGINYLEKIQAAILPCLYGAMLAGVEYVIMGAGIPLKMPGVLDHFAEHKAAEYPMHVTGALEGDDTMMHFDPAAFAEIALGPLHRPKFLAIVSSNTLATTMVKKANGRVDGLVIETRIAGGHNAPPRGKLQLTQIGEPIYGERDAIDIIKLRDLGIPFWLAGGYGHPDMLREALALGAAGVQVGTAFALSDESGLRPDYKGELMDKVLAGTASVFTDPLASPTGFPFKVAQLKGTVSEEAVYEERPRICNLGFLREAYRTPTGGIGYRCASEPITVYLSKGGHVDDTVGRKCICNGLLADIGFPQVMNGSRTEKGIVTVGDDITTVGQFLPAGRTHYSALDVIAELEKGLKPIVEKENQHSAILV
jgi:nitronate monooxygenase